MQLSNPLEGSRVLLKDPHKTDYSPNGWHKVGTTSYKTTRGNNGIAHENWDGGSDYLNNIRANGGSSLNFSFPYDIKATDPKSYIFAATTQLFYTANTYHDLLESLGFTEQAGNFEEVNTGSDGKGSDAVQLNAQDGAGYNNANFATPPDGNRPRMVSYGQVYAKSPCTKNSILTCTFEFHSACISGMQDRQCVMVTLTKGSLYMSILMGLAIV